MFFYLALNLPNVIHFGLFNLTGEVAAGILALSINEGAYMREIIRAGIDSIDRGQMEAAKSLGMRSGLAMRRIVLPQAARVIVPPLGNEFNNMMKTTSLVSIISVYELFNDAQQGYSQTFRSEYFIAVAFWYLILTTAWTFVQATIERRLAASDRGDALASESVSAAAWNPVTAWARGADDGRCGSRNRRRRPGGRRPQALRSPRGAEGHLARVRRRETVCIIGPSGSGKTTFIRCINHLEKVDSGRIEVNGG